MIRRIDRPPVVTGNVMNGGVAFEGIRVLATQPYTWRDALIALGDAVDRHDLTGYAEILRDLTEYLEERLGADG